MVDEHGRAVRPALVFLALAMGGFAIGTTEFATMSLLPYFSQGLGIDEPTAGHVISAYALGVVVARHCSPSSPPGSQDARCSCCS